MLDLWHLPQNATTEFFYCGGTTADWRGYVLPRGAGMVSIMTLGAGGGGGGGQSTATAANRGGGGGGGCGAISILIVPRIFLPDTLYVQVGEGGNGGNAQAAGSAGSNTYVSVYPDSTVAINLVLMSGGGGGGGQSTAGGSAGTLGTNTSAVNNPWASFGQYLNTTGQTGTAGSAAGGSPTSVVWGGTGRFLSGGAGGGGGNTGSAGGNITGDANYNMIPTISGGAIASNGSDGYENRLKMFFTGGAGGGGDVTAGGNGGRGALCCGGGGGGGATTGGKGGDGGNGLVIISTW